MRQNRVELISSLPPRRLWLFIKQLRDLFKRNPKKRQLLPGQTSSPEGVEDAFAIAHDVFKPYHVSRMIYKVADLETFTTWHPDVGLVRNFRSLEEDGHHVVEEIAIVLDKPGSIRDYASKLLEELYGYLLLSSALVATQSIQILYTDSCKVSNYRSSGYATVRR
ncbi:hypothetical protein ABVK25_011529 [Lepraria finkii]|uniref:Coenzyme Q-binding protein COQ10 START domain-containing protein n=1 Tax=Lepraria finkii TaxID=1340010 RepID=A0ABR4ARE9_9LECA